MKSLWVRLGLLVVIGGALVVGVLVFKGNQKRAAGERLLAEALADLRSVEVDGAGRTYIEGLARRYHGEAVAASFDSGGSVTGGTFDVNAYQRTLVDRMIAHARAEGAGHIAAGLEGFKETATLELIPADAPR